MTQYGLFPNLLTFSRENFAYSPSNITAPSVDLTLDDEFASLLMDDDTNDITRSSAPQSGPQVQLTLEFSEPRESDYVPNELDDTVATDRFKLDLQICQYPYLIVGDTIITGKIYKAAWLSYSKAASIFRRSTPLIATIDAVNVCLMLSSPDEVTAWRERKRFLVNILAQSSSLRQLKEQIHELLQFELRFTRMILDEHPKSAEVWAHRRWVFHFCLLFRYNNCGDDGVAWSEQKLSYLRSLESTSSDYVLGSLDQMRKQPAPSQVVNNISDSSIAIFPDLSHDIFMKEMELCYEKATQYRQNYYAWLHLGFARSKCFVLTRSHTFDDPTAHPLVKSYILAIQWVVTNPSDHCGYHDITKIIWSSIVHGLHEMVSRDYFPSNYAVLKELCIELMSIERDNVGGSLPMALSQVYKDMFSALDLTSTISPPDASPLEASKGEKIQNKLIGYYGKRIHTLFSDCDLQTESIVTTEAVPTQHTNLKDSVMCDIVAITSKHLLNRKTTTSTSFPPTPEYLIKHHHSQCLRLLEIWYQYMTNLDILYGSIYCHEAGAYMQRYVIAMVLKINKLFSGTGVPMMHTD